MAEVKLTGEEAADLFVENPESVFFDLDNVMKATGLSPERLRAELAAGRLIAIVIDGKPMRHGDLAKRARVTGAELVRWIAKYRIAQ